ncbi:hypothetical protein [Streptomyces sp. NPDC058665]|uniref:hypothetical protein n=1 Tax=Streptomyces sp. NPDC058665 TaxID=3346586 RepID=UPI0036670661
MTRRTRGTALAAITVLAAAGITAVGGAALADGGSTPPDEVRLVVDEEAPGAAVADKDDCPEKQAPSAPAEAADTADPADAL